jgi:hypothetical protein
LAELEAVAVTVIGVANDAPLYASVIADEPIVVEDSGATVALESLSAIVTGLFEASTSVLEPVTIVLPPASMTVTATFPVEDVPTVKVAGVTATASELTTALRVKLIVFTWPAVIVCVALTVERDDPVPFVLAKVETVNGTLVPTGAVIEIWHERPPPATVVQPGDVEVSGTTVAAPPCAEKVSEFVDAEMYCARRIVDEVVGGAGIATLRVALVVVLVVDFEIVGDEPPDEAAKVDAGRKCDPPPPAQLDNKTPTSAGSTSLPVFILIVP